MGINVLKGNVTIHNYVEKGATVENKYYGTVNQGTHNVSEEESSTPEHTTMTMKDLIGDILPHVKSIRMWFAVYKAFEERGIIHTKDFTGFKKMIEEAYTDGLPQKINPMELCAMNCLSFAKPIEEWDINNAPIKRTAEFNSYKELAKITFDLLGNL
ncbi:MAG: hypothetical protein MJY95_00825 [Bacteroidaceae bacterium]|nr:hypothetical protein [Bacteroidaceae bacterium]